MDTYQAVYDAVRSRISGCDIGYIVEKSLNSAFGGSDHYISQFFQNLEYELSVCYTKPSVLFRPQVFKREGTWYAIYGQETDCDSAVVGKGSTPEEAINHFDSIWRKGE